MAITVLLAKGMMTSAHAQSQDITVPWRLSLRVGAEFNDNRDGSPTNKESNLDGIVAPSVSLLYQDADRSSMQLTLAPVLKWHSNPRSTTTAGSQRDTELFGSIGLEAMHRLTPTVTLNAGDRLAYSDDPEIEDNGSTVRRAESYIRNAAHAGMNAVLTAETGLGLGASSVATRYEDDVVARESDSDSLGGQVTSYHDMGSGWTVLGLVGVSEYQVEGPNPARGYDSVTYNGGVEKKFTPNLVGKVMGGYQVVDYDNPDLVSADGMNGNASLVFQATARTRCRLGVVYGFTPPSDSSYSAQESTTVSGAVDHDVLAERLTASLQCQHSDSQYQQEGSEADGGSEQMTRVRVQGRYRLSHRWSLTGGYAFENWESSVRESFRRNRVDVSVSATW
jgi:hypothetical protein